MFYILTRKGRVLVYHYRIVESQQSYSQLLFENYLKEKEEEIKSSE